MVSSSLHTLLAEIFEVPADQLTAESSTATVATWDSFRHLQAILALEGEYGVQFDPARIPNLTSVGALEAELRRLGADPAASAAAAGR